MGLRRHRAERERQRARHRRLRRRHARLPRHRAAPGRGREPLLHGDRRLRSARRPAARPARVTTARSAPGRVCAATQTPAPMPSRVRRRPVRHAAPAGSCATACGSAGTAPRRCGSRSPARRTRRARRAPSSRALTRPARAARAEKIAARRALARHSRVRLPGDPPLQESLEWGKQNLADLTQTARTSTSAGRTRARSGRPWARCARMTWIGAGFPDYPWLFGVDGEYTAHAAVTLGQFEAIEDHLRALRDISDQLSDRSGVVVHEVVADGSIWYGKDNRVVNPGRRGHVRLQHGRDRQVPGRGGADLALDRRRPLPRRDARLHGARPRVRAHEARRRRRRLAAGQRQRRARPGMGTEKLDNAVYYIRALYDYADMARSAGRRRRPTPPRRGRTTCAARFEATWWIEAEQAYGDSLDDETGAPINQKHWIGATPMEAELNVDGEVVPGLASLRARHGRARDAREQLLQRRAARQPRPVPHRLRRRARRAPASSASSRSTPGSWPSARATTPASAPSSRRATRARTRRRSSRSRRPAGRRTSSRARCRRSCRPSRRRQAPRVDRHAAEHRPLLDLPVDVHAGLGPLRHRLVGRPPAARRAAGPRPRPARGDAAGAGRAAERPGRGHPPRARLGRRAGEPRRAPATRR